MNAHYDTIWRYGRRLGMDISQAEDIAQKTFIVAAGKLSEIEPGKEKTYLMRVASRQCSDVRQSAFSRHSTPLEDAPMSLAPRMTDPELQMSRGQILAILDSALDELPGALREIYVLAEIEELTMAEIAEALDVAAGTVASRLRRARARMHEILCAMVPAEDRSSLLRLISAERVS